MRRLMLLRHAKTEANAASGRDFDRQLDARGVAEAAQIGQWLASQTELPKRILISTAMRARQTWHGVAAALPNVSDVTEVESLYNATPTELMRAIHDDAAEATPLLIVAHNPGLHELALGMTGSGDDALRRALEHNLPTSGLVILHFDARTWSDTGFRRGRLVGFVSPKILRDTEPQTS